MSVLLVEAINALNEKGVKYQARVKDNGMSLAFGVAVPDDKKEKILKEKIEVFVKGEGLAIAIQGKEKDVDKKGLEAFLDTFLKLKQLQEEEAKLFADLVA